ncbi:MAG: hypothetical protein SFU27_06280 [Thermonemataceae bacterium]|nr:hypothetical protein [Thermonemataceae bacterium]
MTTIQKNSLSVATPATTPQRDKQADTQQKRSKKTEESYKPRLD